MADANGAGDDGNGTPYEALARTFHEDGFVALDTDAYALTQEKVSAVYAAVMKRYEQFMAVAKTRAIDLEIEANSERIPGFYVRKGGRIDMQLASMVASLPIDKELVSSVDPVDTTLLTAMETQWRGVVDAIFRLPTDESTTADASKAANYRLEYIGCVLARPGDSDQNWHLDGVHRNLTKHEPADRINVFVPLVDITPEVGGTEMKRRSQFHDDGKRGTSFEDYAELESVTHYVAAGTPLVMDYRVWHRGKANGSQVVRPLLYFKYTRNDQKTTSKDAEKAADERKRVATAVDGSTPQKKKKRVALVSVVK